MRLVFGSIAVERVGPYGFRICGPQCLCIDAEGCGHVLHTYAHGGGAPAPEPWRRMEAAGFAITPVPAYNVHKRPDGSVPHPKGCCLGYILEAGGVRVYVMGDTDLTPEAAKVRDVDVLALPIGGGDVMTPEEAADAVMSIRPRIAVPYHYADRRQFSLFRDIAQPYTQVVRL